MVDGLEGFSHCLKEHPLIVQNEKTKQHYFGLLQYITDHFSNECSRAKDMLVSYKIHILGNNVPSTYTENTIHNSYKQIVKNRLKCLKVYTLRYHFIFDCLCINAYDDFEKCKKITSFLCERFKSKHNSKIRDFVDCLMGVSEQNNFEGMEKQILAWQLNKRHFEKELKRIVFTANMSAGKSTIINALVGNNIAGTAEEACTQAVSFIYDKAFDDKLIDIYSTQYTIKAIDDVDRENICNGSNVVALYFNSCIEREKRICLIDTPGVNSAINKQHKKITQKFIADGDYDTLIYVFNAEALGTDDEYRYLKYIFENVQEEKIIFVVNKLDIYKKGSDTVKDSIDKIVDDLKKIGFKNPIVCPISARFAFLEKIADIKTDITEDEIEELEFFEKKFKRKDYDLSLFYKSEGNTIEDTNLKKSVFYNFERLIYGGNLL